MTYLMRGMIFIAVFGAIVLIERYVLGITQPVAKTMHWLFVVLLAFQIQMLINDLMAYFGAESLPAYRLNYDDQLGKEIPIVARLLVVYPVFCAGFGYAVWHFAHHTASSAVFRGPPS